MRVHLEVALALVSLVLAAQPRLLRPRLRVGAKVRARVGVGVRARARVRAGAGPKAGVRVGCAAPFPRRPAHSW